MRSAPTETCRFGEFGGRIGRITPSGTVTEFAGRLALATQIAGITAGPDGNVWFTEAAADKIGRITPAGVVTEFSSGLTDGPALDPIDGKPFAAEPSSIAVGPDGNLWFTEPFVNRIGRITPAGTITEFATGITKNAFPDVITAGPDGSMWFTEAVFVKVARVQ